ncbi:MAG: class IV adenylate cyclase [Candidatus Liptonbacteria bacterium]|nr:class IV adenylate cyclase [Candidatus Liptonbacteria bacterium]
MDGINLERKHYCPDFEKVRTVLKRIGAKKEIVKNQKDYFFELPILQNRNSARLKLRVENSRKILVYYERPDPAGVENTISDVMLYDVKDNRLLPFLDKALGIKGIVEKKREVWRKGSTIFHLDAVRGVGNIFEIELRRKGEITDKDKAIFKSYQNELMLFLGNVIKGSNVELI